VGMSRTEASLKNAIGRIGKIRDEFWNNLRLTGGSEEFNKSLELAWRVADFIDLGELMAKDALDRGESCGGHFREESQTPDGEALRDDSKYSHVSAWEFKGDSAEPIMNKEQLSFENVKLAQRSYK
jgi:succinate dehydrogenase / fumarate reductase flavoprotein subunit